MHYLEVKNISKTFVGVKALNKVSLSVDCGEVLAIAGENGAGKSTLMKILTGVYQPDAGGEISGGRTTTRSHRGVGRQLLASPSRSSPDSRGAGPIRFRGGHHLRGRLGPS